MLERHPGTDDGPRQVARCHDRRQLPHQLDITDEESDRSQVGRNVENLRRHGRAQKVHPQKADEKKDQEAACSGPEEAVVEADATPDDHREHGRALAMLGLVRNRAQFLAQEGVGGHQNQQHQDQRAQDRGIEVGNGLGAIPGSDQGSQRPGPSHTPGNRDAATVLNGGARRTNDARKLVRSEQCRRRRSRERGKQCGQLDQPATADNRIHEAGKERREPERKEDEIDIHGFVSRETGGHHGVPS